MKIDDEQRFAAYDAVEAAMHGRHGGLVPDIPPARGARAWGEADGYWIAMHVDPVLDALIALGWGPTLPIARIEEVLADALNRHNGTWGATNAEAVRLTDALVAAYGSAQNVV